MDNYLARIELATLKLESLLLIKQPASNASPSDDGKINKHHTHPIETAVSASVSAFNELVATNISPLAPLSVQIGGLIVTQFTFVQEAVQAISLLIETAAVSKRPTPDQLATLIKSLQTALEQVIAIKDKNRQSPLYTQLAVIAEGIPAFGWVVIDPAPAPYIESMRESALFYANKVVKEFKETDKNAVAYAQGFMAFLVELRVYVKKWHTTGLAWNAKGGDATKAALAGGKSVPVATAVNPTAGLRKVDQSEMTHKNPELRTTSVVKAVATVDVKKSMPSLKAVAPPKLELQGNKWIVENYINDAAVVIEKVELKQVVYVYNCVGSTVKINGKVNAITIDNCKKTGILVDSAISTIDLVNCKSVQLQITGTTPTLSVDKTEGLQVFLSAASIGVEIFTAKSSEVNVSFEQKGEWMEKAVCEQFKTVVKDGALVSVAVEHKG